MDRTLLALAGAGAISAPSERARLTMLAHTALLLELDLQLAALVLHSMLLGAPLEGLVVATAAACDTPLVPEAASPWLAAREVAKRNKQLLHLNAHFSGGLACEHLAMRNLVVQFLLQFSDHKNQRAVENIGRGHEPRSQGPERLLRSFLQEWRSRHCSRIHARRLEAIVNKLRELAEKAAQNTLDAGLRASMRLVVDLCGRQATGARRPDGRFEETAALEDAFGETTVEEFQGILISAFAPNFVAFRSKLLDGDRGGPVAAGRALSQAVVSQRRCVVEMALQGMRPDASFILEPVNPSAPSSSFPVGPEFSTLRPKLERALADATRADSVQAVPLSGKNLLAQIASASHDALTDDEDEVSAEYVSVIKGLLAESPSGRLAVGDIKAAAPYLELKRRRGPHEPRGRYGFLVKAEACKVAFDVRGHPGAHANVSLKQAARAAAVPPRASKVWRPKASKKLLGDFPALRGAVRAQEEGVGYVAMCGRLLELYKGRRKELVFDEHSCPEHWQDSDPAFTVATVTSPFALKWSVQSAATLFYRDSRGDILPAWRDDADVTDCLGAIGVGSDFLVDQDDEDTPLQAFP